MYTFLAVLFFLGFVVARRITLSPFGVILTAIRENPERAMAVGHTIQRYKLAVFVIAAAYGGLAGGLLVCSKVTCLRMHSIFTHPQSSLFKRSWVARALCLVRCWVP